MRIQLRCPATVLGVYSQVNISGQLKVVLSLLLLAATVLTVAIAVMETTSSWLRRKTIAEHDSHPLARKKFSVAIATDVNNPELRYGVVIDCGSSGSRVFVYYWPPHTGNVGDLMNVQHMRDEEGVQVVKKISPGLSTYEMKPADASDYLSPLLDYAASHVPANKHAETPLYIMATAGLRVLGESEQKAIMDDLRVDISLKYRFMFVETHAEVISGKQEGVYAWIAINYVLGNFDHSIGLEDTMTVVQVPGQEHSTHIRKQTTGVLDMGGGSLQVAYEVPHSDDLAKSLLAEFNLGCTASDYDHSYRVYVSTFMGYGGNSARKRYEQLLIDSEGNKTVTYKTSNSSSSSLLGQQITNPIFDPCLPLDLMDKIGDKAKTLHIRGTGDYESCLNGVKSLLNTTVKCTKQPCSMNGVYQPRIDFTNSEFYGFSEFYYTSEDLLKIGGNYKYLQFHRDAKEYCSTKWSVLKKAYENKRFPRADYNRYKYQCFKSAWMSRVLHDGLHLPKAYRSFTSLQLIDGKEVHWTLGALLFKTRYFPLSAIQQHIGRPHQVPWWAAVGHLQYATYIIIVCILVVGTAIFIHLRRLRIVRRPDLRKVPSMSYFMPEEDQLQKGLGSVHNGLV